MADRQACERRVYRLATLLTGNPRLAAGVITVVVDARPDLDRLDSAHLDRLTVLRSREIRPGRLVDPALPDEVAETLASLPPQQREAWVFARVYGMPLREIARAMDCSLKAIERHLDQADRAMEALKSISAEEAAKRLLAFSMRLDVPAFYRIQQRRRRIVRQLLAGLVLTLGIALIIVVWRAMTTP
ncbi:MAG: hypothetical protein EA377_06555 [Phycisphaerales bacterium]|nr:MAG: hypothetical protein EA377_06555 [Phycisphaerales bacterium]